jgi:hypothetical protein
MWENTQTIFVQSLERAVTAMARVAPGLLALLAVFGLSMLVAFLVRAGLQHLCARIEIDRWAVRWGVASADPGRLKPSAVVVRFGTWSVIAFGLLLGLAIFDAAARTNLTSRAADYAPHVLAAAVIFVVGIAAARALERQLLISAVNFGLHSARLVAGAARGLIVTVASGMALQHLGVGGSLLPIVVGIVVGGIALALALAFGLGARDAVARSLDRRAGAGPGSASSPGDEPKRPDDVQHM